MIFALGEHEVLIILIAFAFLCIGVPTLAVIAAKLSGGVGARVSKWIALRISKVVAKGKAFCREKGKSAND